MEAERRRTDALEQMLKKHIDEEGGKFDTLLKLLEHNTSMTKTNAEFTERLVNNVSGVSSDLQAFKKEMKPWLEAKIGLNLVWRWAIGIPVIIGVLLSIKTLLAWLGFHR